jgi:hypothetical protein
MALQEILVPNDFDLFCDTITISNPTPINQVTITGNSVGLFNGVNVVSVNLVQISPNAIAYNAIFNPIGDVAVGLNGVSELDFPYGPTQFPSWAVPTTTKIINSCAMVINGVTKQAFFKVVNLSGSGYFSLVIDNAPLSIGSTFRFIGCSGIYTLT